jgi:hypothetical protein
MTAMSKSKIIILAVAAAIVAIVVIPFGSEKAYTADKGWLFVKSQSDECGNRPRASTLANGGKILQTCDVQVADNTIVARFGDLTVTALTR